MRVGVNSRGSTWVSMGPLGWFIASPFIVTWWLIKLTLIILVALVQGIVAFSRAIGESRQARRIAQRRPEPHGYGYYKR